MSFYLFYLLIVFVVGLSSYVVTNNIIYCIVTTSIFLIYFVVFEVLAKRKIYVIKRKKDDLSIFLHDFLSVYYAEPNIDKSLQFASMSVSNELQEELKMIEDYKSIEKLKNLSNYFSSDLYELFLGIITSKETNKKELVDYVRNENEFILKESIEFNKGIRKTVLEYLILWLAASLILVAMKFAIHNYFKKISTSIFYLAGVSLFYLVFILSVHFMIRGCIRKYE